YKSTSQLRHIQSLKHGSPHIIHLLNFLEYRFPLKDFLNPSMNPENMLISLERTQLAMLCL
ncbi:MAG: hypothetical protein VW496_03770, partial [Pelagibacteraceae bacterium]